MILKENENDDDIDFNAIVSCIRIFSHTNSFDFDFLNICTFFE